MDDHIMEHIIDSSSKRAQQSPKCVELSKKPRLLQVEGISIDDPLAQVTTLIKALPFASIPPLSYGTPEEIEEHEECMKKLKENCVTTNESGEKTGLYEKDYIEEISMRTFDPGTDPISAGPVLQIISISILKENDPDWEDLIYGDISVTDYLGNTYYVYNCAQDDPEQVSNEWDLILKECPVAPVMGTKLKFSLTSVDGTIKFFDKGKDYYLKDTLDCDNEESQDFIGEGDYVARVVFDRTPLAIIVELHFFLAYTPQSYDEGDTFNVHGRIKVNNIVCWEPPKGQTMFCGKICAFKQSRHLFAAPAEIPIRVDISWSSGDMEFKEIYEALPRYGFSHYPFRQAFSREDKDYTFILDTCYTEHDDFFRVRCSDYLDMKRNPDIRQVYQSLYFSTDPSDFASVEVFSVLIGGLLSSSPLPPICGQIVVQDRQGRVYIFARDKERSDKCSSNEQRFKRTLSLVWPDRWFLENDFYMHLKLKDAEDYLVCKSYLSWDSNSEKRFDRRVCDFIRCENGYFVAVHYSVFLNGKKAKVSVKCSEGGHQYCFVYGSIFAEYDNYDDYYSTYDKECYRIIIFNRSEEDCVKVKSGSKIPLAKSHVSAPLDCKSLFIHVDMCVCQSYDQRAVGKLVFEAGSSSTPQVRSCGDGLGRVTVEVEWVSD